MCNIRYINGMEQNGADFQIQCFLDKCKSQKPSLLLSSTEYWNSSSMR